MTDFMLYKYRSLDNWKFLLDIFLKRRLFAASFRSLNDPMEGRYYYAGDDVSKEFIRSVGASKDYWKICSLSTKPTSTLMWSYYGGGHTGIALGVSIRPARTQRVLPVRYDNHISLGARHLRKSARSVALDILTQKQLAWSHEDEVRVFSARTFVSIQLKTVLLGCQISAPDENLVRLLVSRTAPRTAIRKLRRSELDAPLPPVAPGRGGHRG